MEKPPENSLWFDLRVRTWKPEVLNKEITAREGKSTYAPGELVKRKAYNLAGNTFSKSKAGQSDDLIRNEHVTVTGFLRNGNFGGPWDCFCTLYVSFNIFIIF